MTFYRWFASVVAVGVISCTRDPSQPPRAAAPAPAPAPAPGAVAALATPAPSAPLEEKEPLPAPQRLEIPTVKAGDVGDVFIDLSFRSKRRTPKAGEVVVSAPSIRIVLEWRMRSASDFALLVKSLTFPKGAQPLRLISLLDLPGMKYEGSRAASGRVRLSVTFPRPESSYSADAQDVIALLNDVVRSSIEIELPKTPVKDGDTWSSREEGVLAGGRVAFHDDFKLVAPAGAGVVVEAKQSIELLEREWQGLKSVASTDETVVRRELVQGSLIFDLDFDNARRNETKKGTKSVFSESSSRARVRRSKTWTD